MTLAFVHARAETLQLLRYPAYVVPTILFPALLLLAVGSHIEQAEGRTLAGFAATAVLGIAFFQFGVGIANTRTLPWERYVRTLATSPHTRLAGRVLSALSFALAAALLVGVVGALIGLRIEAWRYAALGIALLVGAIPFALFGIALGYWLSPKTALPVANLLFFPLALAGALWGKPDEVPRSVDVASQILPTRSWMEILEASAGSAAGVPLHHVAALVAWTVAFGALAWWGYRRDEGERFT